MGGGALKNYYLGQHPHLAEDYSVANRLSVVGKLGTSVGNFLDFGGNSWLSFHDNLVRSGWTVEIQDVAREASRNVFDVIACYFVFEHLVNLDSTVRHLASILAAGGNLIVEVPDSLLYDETYAGLLHEHQQHFQLSSLVRLMNRHGFAEVWSTHEESSRDFGFVSIFERQTKKQIDQLFPNHSAPEKFAIARKKQSEEIEFPAKFFDGWLDTKKLIVFWGANDNLELALGSGLLQRKQILVLDISSAKRNMMSALGLDFMHPDDFIATHEEILEVRSLTDAECEVVITASAHAAHIASRVRPITANYRVFDPMTGQTHT